MGVRISWLMLARNSLFVRLAHSARCLALSRAMLVASNSACVVLELSLGLLTIADVGDRQQCMSRAVERYRRDADQKPEHLRFAVDLQGVAYFHSPRGFAALQLRRVMLARTGHVRQASLGSAAPRRHDGVETTQRVARLAAEHRGRGPADDLGEHIVDANHFRAR